MQEVFLELSLVFCIITKTALSCAVTNIIAVFEQHMKAYLLYSPELLYSNANMYFSMLVFKSLVILAEQ